MQYTLTNFITHNYHIGLGERKSIWFQGSVLETASMHAQKGDS